MERCDSCKHWGESRYHLWDFKKTGFVDLRECDRAEKMWDAEEYVHDDKDAVTGISLKDPTAKMFVEDGSSYMAVLWTLPDFGCVLWEGK